MSDVNLTNFPEKIIEAFFNKATKLVNGIPVPDSFWNKKKDKSVGQTELSDKDYLSSLKNERDIFSGDPALLKNADDKSLYPLYAKYKSFADELGNPKFPLSDSEKTRLIAGTQKAFNSFAEKMCEIFIDTSKGEKFYEDSDKTYIKEMNDIKEGYPNKQKSSTSEDLKNSSKVSEGASAKNDNKLSAKTKSKHSVKFK